MQKLVLPLRILETKLRKAVVFITMKQVAYILDTSLMIMVILLKQLLVVEFIITILSL